MEVLVRRLATLATRLGAFAALGLGALVPPADATTYVLGPDSHLAETADAIVEGRIVGTALSASPGSTVYLLEVDRVLSGWVGGSVIPVRVVGGSGSTQVELRGVPRFLDGEKVMLFLMADREGQWGILHLALGAFSELEVGGRRLAVRQLDEAEIVGDKSGSG